jgi:hypothetical protein
MRPKPALPGGIRVDRTGGTAEAPDVNGRWYRWLESGHCGADATTLDTVPTSACRWQARAFLPRHSVPVLLHDEADRRGGSSTTSWSDSMMGRSRSTAGSESTPSARRAAGRSPVRPQYEFGILVGVDAADRDDLLPHRRAGGPTVWPANRRLQSNFVATALKEGESQTRRPGIPRTSARSTWAWTSEP